MIVKIKKDFIREILKMEFPIMTEKDYGNWQDSPTSSIMVYDREDVSKKFWSQTTTSNYNETQHDDARGTYKKRRTNRMMVFERWLYEICGDYCLCQFIKETK